MKMSAVIHPDSTAVTASSTDVTYSYGVLAIACETFSDSWKVTP